MGSLYIFITKKYVDRSTFVLRMREMAASVLNKENGRVDSGIGF